MDETQGAMPMQPMTGGPPMDGKTVTVMAHSDGSFMVDETQVATLDEALDLVRQLLQPDTENAEEQVQAGYKSGRMMGRPSPQQVFGE